MRRALPFLASASLVACAAPPLAPPAQAPSAAPPEAAPVTMGGTPMPPAAPCHPARLPLEGFSACMPAEPVEIRGAIRHGSYHGLRAPIDGGGSFWVERMRSDSTPTAPQQPNPTSWHRAEASHAIEVDGFSGNWIEGQMTPNFVDHMTTKMVVVGDSLFIATVQSPPGAHVDRRAVEALLDSFHVELPWRIHAAPGERFTVAVPEPAVVRHKDSKTSDGQTATTATFALGGREDRDFEVAAVPLLRVDTRTPDEVLASGVDSFATTAGNAVLGLRDVASGGLRGREIVGRKAAGGHIRLRFFVAAGRIYVVVMEAKSREAIADGDAERFFESFQITAP